jgi:GT2 family glycosyltransferase
MGLIGKRSGLEKGGWTVDPENAQALTVEALMADVSVTLARSKTTPGAVFWTRRAAGERMPEVSASTLAASAVDPRSSSLAPSTPGWDIWLYDVVPRRKGMLGLIILMLKRAYLHILRPFHNELLRRQRELNGHLLSTLSRMDQDVRGLKQALDARKRQAPDALKYTPKFSIIMPVWNTNPSELRNAIQSVEAQTYPYWELCICDDGSDVPGVAECLSRINALDSRVRVRHSTSRNGIAVASNTALAMATGDFVAFLDHDDELAPHALQRVVEALNADQSLDLLYSDEDHLEDGVPVQPRYKPAWSPDLFLSYNYICHFCVIRRSLIAEVGGFRRGFDGAQDYDLLLRVTERTSRITRIPDILYHWRKSATSVSLDMANKPKATENGKRALQDAMTRRGVDAEIQVIEAGQYRVRRRIQGRPKVSIIILTRDRLDYLKPCIESIRQKTLYPNYEILVVDHESRDPATISYLGSASVRVLRYAGSFNFSRMNNLAACSTDGEYLIFLNNDTEVITSEWLEAMLEHSQRAEVGVVGAKLLFPTGTIQHAGIALGVDGRPSHHILVGHSSQDRGYENYLQVVRNCAALTGACVMIRRRVFNEIEGFDERFSVTYGDVDLCLRTGQRGYLNVWTPFAVLYHREFGTRPAEDSNDEDQAAFIARWTSLLGRGDPHFNPNLGPI